MNNITIDTLLIIAACVCLIVLMLNVVSRINLLALALLLFFITFLTGCTMSDEKTKAGAAGSPAAQKKEIL